MKKSLLLGIALVVVLGISSFAFLKGGGKDVYSIETPYGIIKVKLYDETPRHRDNFIKLMQEKKYDGTLFHRVIKGFMVQGGDLDSKNAKPGQQLGAGDAGYTIPAEINPKFFHKKGALAAARQSDQVNPKKASSGSQFYIVTGEVMDANKLKEIEKQALMGKLFADPANAGIKSKMMELYQQGKSDSLKFYEGILEQQAAAEMASGKGNKFSPAQVEAYTTIGGAPFLDGEYTVFGEVIEGMDVLDKIAAEEVDANSRPVKDIPMTIK